MREGARNVYIFRWLINRIRERRARWYMESRLDLEGREGKCLGLADGKIVVEDERVERVMEVLQRDYSDKRISILTVPKADKILIL